LKCCGEASILEQVFFDMARILEILKRIPLIGFFAEKSFIHYAWMGSFFSLLNIILLWLLIDFFLIPTLISSTIVVGGTFLLRYAFFRWFKIM